MKKRTPFPRRGRGPRPSRPPRRGDQIAAYRRISERSSVRGDFAEVYDFRPDLRQGRPHPLHEAEVDRCLWLIEHAIESVDRVLATLPAPPPRAGELRRLRRRWSAKSGEFCERLAVSMELDLRREVFAGGPLNPDELRARLRLPGRADFLVRLLEDALPLLTGAVLRWRSGVVDLSEDTLRRAEARLQDGGLSPEQRRRIERHTALLRQVLGEHEANQGPEEGDDPPDPGDAEARLAQALQRRLRPVPRPRQ